MSREFELFKSDDKQLVFGWASVAADESGAQLTDQQGDVIDPGDLEEGAYKFVLKFRATGEEHIPTLRNKGRLVESCVFTEEKQRAIGIPAGTVPIGWWVGFKIDDPKAWGRIKDGTYNMFSVEGAGIRTPIKDKPEQTPNKPMTFLEVLKSVDITKYNPYHDARGQFTTASGNVSGKGVDNGGKSDIISTEQGSKLPKSQKISRREYKRLCSQIATDFPTLPADGKVHNYENRNHFYRFRVVEFGTYTFIYKIRIEGNEKLIKELKGLDG